MVRVQSAEPLRMAMMRSQLCRKASFRLFKGSWWQWHSAHQDCQSNAFSANVEIYSLLWSCIWLLPFSLPPWQVSCAFACLQEWDIISKGDPVLADHIEYAKSTIDGMIQNKNDRAMHSLSVKIRASCQTKLKKLASMLWASTSSAPIGSCCHSFRCIIRLGIMPIRSWQDLDLPISWSSKEGFRFGCSYRAWCHCSGSVWNRKNFAYSHLRYWKSEP